MVCSSQVRQSGQRILGKGLSVFAFSYRTLLDGVTRYLTNDDDVEHHQYKVRPHRRAQCTKYFAVTQEYVVL